MKLLVLSHLVPYPPTSGVVARCYNLLREVAQHHEVHLLAFNQSLMLPGPEQVEAATEELRRSCASVRVFALPHDATRWQQAAIYARNLLSAEPYFFPRFRSEAFARAVHDVIEKHSIDLVQCETIAMAPYAEGIADRPTLLVHQNVESDLLRRRARSERNPALRAFFGLQAPRVARYEDRYLKSMSAHVMVSEDDRSLLVGRARGARVVVVPNGVDTAYFAPGRPAEAAAPELIFVGGMSWYPNSDAITWFLDSIWPEIRRQRPDVRFTAVGSHPCPALLRAAEEDPEHVAAPGLVPDIRPLVDRAALFVCPFRVGGGTRLKILDAWAMGKPLLSTGVGCEGLGAENGRDLVIADEPGAFANEAVALLGDAARRQRLGERGRERALAEYAWPVVGRALLDLYGELTAR